LARIFWDLEGKFRYNVENVSEGQEIMTDLYVISGPDGKVRTHEVQKESLLVGRSTDNDIQVPDRFVSRKHLKILKKGEKLFIKDLFSKNGTFVNGELINPGVEYPLAEGLPIVIGMSVICLGRGCSEEILSFLESSHLSRLAFAEDELPLNRPSTVQNNMELIYKICNALTQTLDLRETLSRVLQHVFDVFARIDRGAIILLDTESGQIRETVTRTKHPASPLQYSTEVVKRVLERREAVMISDADTEQSEGELPETLKLLNIKSVMCVPLISRAKLWGVLYADSVTKPYGFRGEDLYLLNALSSPVAMAIENALFKPRIPAPEQEV
jgi:pSer/pThr/pTyr-binding forkhead associated (FHA) protein